jgi:hypothetical protein
VERRTELPRIVHDTRRDSRTASAAMPGAPGSIEIGGD